MIHPSGIFDYQAEFTSDSFRESDIVVQGAERSVRDIDRLVGHHPTIRFWGDSLVLIASGKSNSMLRNASFKIGDAVSLSACPGDQLYVVRTGAGGIGLSLLRERRLVLALGAVAAVPLGTSISVFKRPEIGGRLQDYNRDTWLEFQVGSEQLESRTRVVSKLGEYEIYIEHGWEDGIPGTDECVSICGANDPLINIASIRSAVLLAHSELKMTSWDGAERFV